MIEYSVPDMTCGGCARRIRQAILELDPAAQVEIDLKAQRVRVQSHQDPQRVAAKMMDAGYTPLPFVN